jgi:pimeloyl-ACP methyl ester carboxylesterase
MTLLARALAIACLALLGVAPAAYAVDASVLKPFPCPEDYGRIDGSVVRHCGHLRTSEQPGGIGRAIDLAVVVVIPADSKAAKRPPIVLAHGGPGAGVVDDWASIASLPVAQLAPLVVFDQRAVGRSTPNLCKFLDEDDPTLDDDDIETLRKRNLSDARKCVDQLTAEGVSLANYGTAATVRDMETLRTALKIDRWTVYGISYGTTVTLAYLAAHPERVATAIIDSVYPPEMPGFTSTLTDFLTSLDAMNDLCAQQPGCSATFGDLTDALNSALGTLKNAPLSVTIWNETKNAYQTRALSDSTLLSIVVGKSMWTTYWPYVPRLIADVRERRVTPLVTAMLTDLIDDIAFRNNGIYLATECFERAPFEDRARLKGQAARWPEIARAAAVDANLDTCALWPAKQPEQAKTPTSVAPPVLVLAGEWDPATPAEQARRTAALLGPSAKLVVVPKAGHSVSIGDPCGEAIVATFVAVGQFTGNPNFLLNTDCLLNRKNPTLATRVIAVDEAAAYNVDALPASSYIFAVALLTSLIWPVAYLAGRRSPAPWRHSPLWLTVAAMGVVTWVVPAAQAMYATRDVEWLWVRYGIPAETWPAFPALVLVFGAAVTGLALLLREWSRDELSVAQLFHRGFVLTGLAAVFISLWQLGLLAEALPHALDATRALAGV